MKNRYLVLALVFLLAVASLAGCKPAVDPEPTPAEVPSLPSEIRLAVIAPLSGPQAAMAGREGQEGTSLAVAVINAAGGINGSKLVLDFFDDRADASEAAALAQKVVDDPRYTAVIAHFSTDACFAAMSIYEEAGIAMLTPWASHHDLTRRSDVTFRMSASTEVYGGAHADAITEYLDKSKVALIYATTEYTIGHATEFKSRLAQKGGTVVAEETYFVGDTDFAPQITNIMASGAEVLAVVAYPQDGAFIVKQARDRGLSIPIVGSPTVSGPQVEEIAGEAMDGMVIPSSGVMVKALSGASGVPNEVGDYRQAYFAEYNRYPRGAWDAQAYDVVRVIAHAIGIANSAERGVVLETLRTINDFQGVLGILFDGERAMVPHLVFQEYNYATKSWSIVVDNIEASKYVKK